jgi:hypothetical protein
MTQLEHGALAHVGIRHFGAAFDISIFRQQQHRISNKECRMSNRVRRTVLMDFLFSAHRRKQR